MLGEMACCTYACLGLFIEIYYNCFLFYPWTQEKTYGFVGSSQIRVHFLRPNKAQVQNFEPMYIPTLSSFFCLV